MIEPAAILSSLAAEALGSLSFRATAIGRGVAVGSRFGLPGRARFGRAPGCCGHRSYSLPIRWRPSIIWQIFESRQEPWPAKLKGKAALPRDGHGRRERGRLHNPVGGDPPREPTTGGVRMLAKTICAGALAAAVALGALGAAQAQETLRALSMQPTAVTYTQSFLKFVDKVNAAGRRRGPDRVRRRARGDPDLRSAGGGAHGRDRHDLRPGQLLSRDRARDRRAGRLQRHADGEARERRHRSAEPDPSGEDERLPALAIPTAASSSTST